MNKWKSRRQEAVVAEFEALTRLFTGKLIKSKKNVWLVPLGVGNATISNMAIQHETPHS